MQNFALEHIQKLKPYQPPIDFRHNYPGLLLDFNERTIEIDPAIKNALINFIQNKRIEAYPEYFDLNQKIAKYTNLLPENIFLVNGSDQGMDIVVRTFSEKQDKIIIPSPTFSMFYQVSAINDNQIICPEYKKPNLAFPLEETLDLLEQNCKILIICNPNNPTGSWLEESELILILNKALKNKTLVLIDEAYYEFSGLTATNLINEYPNLIISRTFSKAFGLAGLRIAYLISNATNLQELNKVRGPYDMNILATIAAKAGLENIQNIKDYTNEVMFESKPMVEKFFLENKINYYASKGNFILFDIDDPEEKINILEKAGFRLRMQKHPLLQNTLRVTIGTKKQMIDFLKTFQEKFC